MQLPFLGLKTEQKREIVMFRKPAEILKTITHPYIFVLKEGEAIKNNPFDYSLMMFSIYPAETIGTQKGEVDPFTDQTSTRDFFNSHQ